MSDLTIAIILVLVGVLALWWGCRESNTPPRWVAAVGGALVAIGVALGIAKARKPADPPLPDPVVVPPLTAPAGPTKEAVKSLDDAAAKTDAEIVAIREEAKHEEASGNDPVDVDALGDFVRQRESELRDGPGAK